ncbi:hypothetical protein ACHAXM_007479 [Skeletonema potamos]
MSTALPGMKKRYLSSFIGLFHATSSSVALIVGNYLFLQCFLLRNDILASSEVNNGSSSKLPTIFHVATSISGSTVLIFFWNLVQSYQHSTTKKSLTGKQLQNFNRARGIFSLLLCAVYPLMYRHLPDDILQDSMFCRVVSAMTLAVTFYMYTLIKDYGKGLFILYGGSKLGFSLHLLCTGSLYSLRESYPYIVNFFEKEALLISCCVEFGFLLYYCESRRIVSVQFVREACKRYHPILMYVFAGTMMTEKWWNRLPMSVSWAMFLDTFLVSLYAYKMLKGLFAAIIETGRPKKEDNIDRREAFAKNERAKSLFDVTSSSGRRSSIFESIDIGALSTASDSSSDFVKEE